MMWVRLVRRDKVFFRRKLPNGVIEEYSCPLADYENRVEFAFTYIATNSSSEPMHLCRLPSIMQWLEEHEVVGMMKLLDSDGKQ